jgi:4'-phosphopantetheinyl transferase
VTLGDAIGVDVEYIRRDVDVIRIAKQFFSRREFAMLHGLEAEQQIKSFFKCWTQKEAYAKARGEGLSHALSQFEVNCAPGTRGELLSVTPDLHGESHWTVMAIPIGSSYSAALAVRRRDLEVRYWKWEQKCYSR